MPLCMGCLNEIPAADSVCDICGFNNAEKQAAPFLPYGTVLNNKYVVAKNLDTNGESTRYLGYDRTNGRIIAVREFLPIGLFDRSVDETKLFVTPQDKNSFNEALSAFQNYFDALKNLTDNSASVAVIDTFAANNTYYAIEENDDHISFTEYLDHNGGHLEWDMARPLFMPIITLLENLHKSGIGHYAVSPSNLYVTSTGKLKLGGFATEYERKRGTMLKSQLYSGCAAPEQYSGDIPLDIATDIYGFTATMFFALTGKLPANAKDREKDARLLISTNTVKRLPPHVVSALANGLQMKRENRIADFDDLRSQLSVSSTVQAIQNEISRTASMTPIKREQARKSNVNPTAVGIIAAIFSLLVFAALGLWWLSQDPHLGIFEQKPTTIATEPPTIEGWTGDILADYTGKTLAEVQGAYKGEIKISSDGDYSDDIPKGSVIRQEPPAGSPDSNGVLYLDISKGPRMAELPDVIGKSSKAAAEELTELGLVVTQKVEFNSDYSEGKVIKYEENKPGDKIETDKEIVLIVSRGEEPADNNNDYYGE